MLLTVCQPEFEKDNVKLKESNEKEMKPKELEERLEAADEFAKRLKSDRKAKKVEGRGDADKVAVSLRKMQERIAAAKTAATDRDEGKETSLGTSKINYIGALVHCYSVIADLLKHIWFADPRLTYAWCAKHGVPVEKMFSKTVGAVPATPKGRQRLTTRASSCSSAKSTVPEPTLFPCQS